MSHVTRGEAELSEAKCRTEAAVAKEMFTITYREQMADG